MADPDPRLSDGVAVNSENPAAGGGSLPAVPTEGNHAPAKAAPGPDPAPQAASNDPDDRSGLDRAEEIVDHLAERLSSLASGWMKKCLRLGSRARESAQDFWAEVQDFRHGKKP
jgi:hypothetical protein